MQAETNLMYNLFETEHTCPEKHGFKNNKALPGRWQVGLRLVELHLRLFHNIFRY